MTAVPHPAPSPPVPLPAAASVTEAPSEGGASIDDLFRHLRNARRRIAEVERRAEEQRASLREELEAEFAGIDKRVREMTAEDTRRAAELEGRLAAILAEQIARDPSGPKSLDRKSVV